MEIPRLESARDGKHRDRSGVRIAWWVPDGIYKFRNHTLHGGAPSKLHRRQDVIWAPGGVDAPHSGTGLAERVRGSGRLAKRKDGSRSAGVRNRSDLPALGAERSHWP